MKDYKRSSYNLINRRVSLVITLCGLTLILACTLSPYDFCFKETNNSLAHNILILGRGKSTVLDVFKNVVMFLPLGFGLSCYLMQVRRMEGLKSLATTILVSLGLSYTVEVLQMFLPSRIPSLIDVLSNSAGGVVGFLCFLLFESKVKVIDNASVSMKRNLQLSFLGYVIFAFLISVSLQHFSSLKNWDNTFPLLLGNERTGDRLWHGYISEIYIVDRALTETEVAHNFSKKDSIASLRSSLLALYLFKGIGSYDDEIGNLPDLVWRVEPRDVQRGKGVLLGHNNWLESEAPAEYLVQRIVGASQFTLGMTVATSDTKQTGPARIISLSEDTSHRNFTLGQSGSDLEFRLRTPLTGENGGEPRLKVPDVFSTTNPHNLIIVYDGSLLRIYVDVVHNSHILELSPGVILFCSLIPLNTYSILGHKAMHYVYYFIVFVPLGIMIASAVKIMRSRFVIKILIIFGCTLLPPFILEGILVSVSGRVVSLENLLISMIFMTIPIIFLRYVIPHRPEKRET